MKKTLAYILTFIMVLSNLCTFAVTAFGASVTISSIDITLEKAEIYENTFGSMIWETVGEEEIEYYRYDLNSIGYKITINYEDGSSETNWNGGEDSVTSDQSAENPWGIGTHEFIFVVDGTEYSVPVTIKALDIVSIEAENPEVVIYENTSGYENEYYNEETGTYKAYWHYYIPDYNLVFTYEDGTSETVYAYNIYSEFGVSQEETDTQFTEPWGLGSHEITISLFGLTTSLNIVIEELPLIGFTVEPTESTTYYVNSNGYENERYVEETDSYESYWYYYEPSYNIILELSDGTTETYNSLWDVEEKYGINTNYTSDQYSNPWGIGEHEFVFTIGDMQAALPIEIVELPITSFVINPTDSTTYYEYTNGYWDSYYDDETASYVDFWYYETPSYDITITLDNGTTETLYRWEFREKYGLDVNVNHTQYSEPWTVGTHNVTYSIGELQYDLPITIEKLPVSAISIKTDEPLVYYQNTNGYQDYRWDDAEEDNVAFWCYYSPDYYDVIVTYDDGTTKTLDKWDFYDEFGAYPTISDDQNSNPWDVGEHEFIFTFGECEATLPVTIKGFVVEGVTITPTESSSYYEGTNGYLTGDWNDETGEYDNRYWYYYIPDFEITLTLADGSTITADRWEIEDEYGLVVSVSNTQHAEPWGIGSHNVTVTVGISRVS